MAGAVRRPFKFYFQVMDATDCPWHPSFKTISIQLNFCVQAYNNSVLEFIFQLLAIYLFVATPCFAGWIANSGKWEDVGIPVIGSILLASVFIPLVFLFA
jgi:hypothetical protein